MPSHVDYLNFDVAITKLDGKYRAKVQSSLGGEASSEFKIPFSDVELENFFLRIGQPRRDSRRNYQVGTHSKTVQEFGRHLYEAVFQSEVQECLRSSLEEALRQKKGLRIRLRLTETPELLNLPWEYLYNAKLNRFLALSIDTPLVRYLELPSRSQPLIVHTPLRVLVMISCPKNHFQLDVEKEWGMVKTAVTDLEKAGLLIIERLEKATLADLQHRLRHDDFNIFHFIGHGAFDDQTQSGVLLFEDEYRNAVPVTGGFLGTVLHDCKSLRLVILNACEGARAAKEDPFAGTAQSLIQQDIPAAVAMQFEITDGAAITFSHEFYQAIADGFPVDASLTEVRKIIFGRGNAVEWGTPVLYMRSPDGRIFTVDRSILGKYDADEQNAEYSNTKQPTKRHVDEKLTQKDSPVHYLTTRRKFFSSILILLLVVLVGVSGQQLLNGLMFSKQPTPTIGLLPTWTATIRVPTKNVTPIATTLASVTEIPTPVFTPTPSSVVTATTDINVRGGPGTNYSIVDKLANDATANVMGRDPSGEWWQVRLNNGIVGWVYKPLVTIPENATSVALITDIPAPPQPTPTATLTVTPIPSDTPTVKPTSTATDMPTATPTPLKIERVIFGDDFSSNRNKWGVGEFNDEVGNFIGAYFIGGKYILVIRSQRDIMQRFQLPDLLVTDFILSVDASISESSSSAAIAISFRENNNNFYRIAFSNSGVYDVSLHKDRSWKTIHSGTFNNVSMDDGAVNTFAILVSGSDFTIFVNGQKLDVVSDSTLANSGLVGLASILDQGGQRSTVEFDNLVIGESQ